MRGILHPGQTPCRDAGALACEWSTSLDGLGPEWDRLALACPTRHPQYLFDWLEPWWKHVGSRRGSLSCVRVRNGDETVAIAPLILVRRRTRGVVRLREIQWLGTGPSDQADILSTGDPRVAGAAVAAHLIRHRRSWDELHLESVPERSEAVEALIEALRIGFKCSVGIKRAPAFFIDTSDGDWAGYLAARGKSSVRQKLPRDRRKLGLMGEMQIRHDRDVDVRELLEEFTAFHRVRQAQLGRESGLADEQTSAFATEALERFRRRGILSVWTLTVGGDFGACMIGFEMEKVYYFWTMTHDPAYGAGSPGMVLWARIIQACFEDETIDEFDMMRGDTEYKLKWTNNSRDLLNLRVRNLSTRRSTLLNRLRRPMG